MTESDDDAVREPAGGFPARETRQLYRLTPSADDLAQRSRQIAIIAAQSEDEARAFAAAADPFGRDWLSERLFRCDVFEDMQTHVVGDVTFRSIAAPSNRSPGKKMRR